MTRLRVDDDPAVVQAAAPDQPREGIAGSCDDEACSSGTAVGKTKDGRTDIVNWSGLTPAEVTHLVGTVTGA